MFDQHNFELDKEVDRWCRSVLKEVAGNEDAIAELKDHLYCEIDALRILGMPDQQAFIRATERMGSVEELMAEYSKNTGVVRRILMAFANKFSHQAWVTAIYTFLYLILFAIMTTSISRILEGTDYFSAIGPLLYVLWVSPLLVFASSCQAVKSEWACIKRMLKPGLK